MVGLLSPSLMFLSRLASFVLELTRFVSFSRSSCTSLRQTSPPPSNSSLPRNGTSLAGATEGDGDACCEWEWDGGET